MFEEHLVLLPRHEMVPVFLCILSTWTIVLFSLVRVILMCIFVLNQNKLLLCRPHFGNALYSVALRIYTCTAKGATWSSVIPEVMKRKNNLGVVTTP